MDIFEIEPDPDAPIPIVKWLEGATPTHISMSDAEMDADLSDAEMETDADSDVETNAIDDVDPAESETATRVRNVRNARNTRNALDNVGRTREREAETLDNTLESRDKSGYSDAVES